MISLLGAALGLAGFDGDWDVAAVSSELSRSHSRFAGIDLATVGRGGLDLAAAETAAPRAAGEG